MLLDHVNRAVAKTKSTATKSKWWVTRYTPIFHLFPKIYPRKFQAYCIGAPRTGTNSIAGLFSDHYRAHHEPEPDLLLRKILSCEHKEIHKVEFTEFIKHRDRRLWLELESNHLLHFAVDILVEEFPDAKFILTIRDCHSWLESIISHQINFPKVGFWQDAREILFNRGGSIDAKEQLLVDNQTYSIDGYLTFWREHIRKMLDSIPAERLLVVRTHEISDNVAKIAAFLNIPAENLNLSKSHEGRSPQIIQLLSKIDQKYLAEKYEIHCREIMDKYFPDF